MELFKRILIAIVFIPIILLVFYSGGFVLTSFFAIVVFVQMFEIREMLFKKGIFLPKIIIPLSIPVFIASAHYELNEILVSFLIIFIVISGNDLFKGRLEGAFSRISASMFSIIYTAVFLSTICRIRVMENGTFLIMSLMILTWITDICAYFAGRFFGKHRGIFKASPKKTLEGFIAGTLSSFAVAFIIAYFIELTLFQTLSLAVSAGIFGQFGDLFESMIKRDAGIKDSSTLLPGHGGLLDRFDSLLISSPVLYILLIIF